MTPAASGVLPATASDPSRQSAPPQFVDSHSHLDDAAFDTDRDAVVTRARAAGVTRQVVPAITAAEWPKLKSVCAEHEGLHPAYGLHPLCLAQHARAHLDELAAWVERERPCAIGECGLDFYVEGLDADTQRFYFEGQLALAREFDLPVVVHARRAVEDVTRALKRIGGLRGVVHSYAGSEEQARQLFQLGFHLGFGGPVTYERANRIRRVVASMPLEWMLLETDAPDQPLSTRRGRRNEPACLVDVAATIAQLRGSDVETIAAATSENARRLFALPA